MKPRTSVRSLLAALVIASAGGQLATAQTVIPIPDFSFENHTNIAAGGNNGLDNTGTNWVCSQANSSESIYNITGVAFTNATTPGTLPPSADGTNYMAENIVTPGSAAYCWQDIGLLLPNTTYALTIAVGQSLVGLTNPPLATGQGFIGLFNGPNPFQPLLAATLVDNTFLTAGTFADYTVVVTTPAVVSGDLTIAMEGTNGAQLCFDNVRLTKAPAVNPTALLPAISSPAANPAALPSAPSASATVYVGSVVTLSEHPAGTAPFTYQWLSDNSSGGTSFTAISLATNATYVVTNSTSLTVEYQVIVTNSLGNASTSAPVTLTVFHSAPVIVQDNLPLTASDVVGSTETFSVVVDGDRPLAYQWLVDYGSGVVPIAGTPANGTTNATLTLTNLQISDTGVYICAVTNEQSPAGVSSTGTYLSVIPVPAADSFGVILSPAQQYGYGGQTEFPPTWTVATNSLIAGFLPTSVSSTGNFALFACGGTNALTDGSFGTINSTGAGMLGFATMGNPTSVGGFLRHLQDADQCQRLGHHQHRGLWRMERRRP